MSKLSAGSTYQRSASGGAEVIQLNTADRNNKSITDQLRATGFQINGHLATRTNSNAASGKKKTSGHKAGEAVTIKGAKAGESITYTDSNSVEGTRSMPATIKSVHSDHLIINETQTNTDLWIDSDNIGKIKYRTAGTNTKSTYKPPTYTASQRRALRKALR